MSRRDPREEKTLDYLHESRNTYGENDKSSRKAIRFRKAWVNRTYRRAVDAALDPTTDPDLQAGNDVAADVSFSYIPKPVSLAHGPRQH